MYAFDLRQREIPMRLPYNCTVYTGCDIFKCVRTVLAASFNASERPYPTLIDITQGLPVLYALFTVQFSPLMLQA